MCEYNSAITTTQIQNYKSNAYLTSTLSEIKHTEAKYSKKIGPNAKYTEIMVLTQQHSYVRRSRPDQNQNQYLYGTKNHQL